MILKKIFPVCILLLICSQSGFAAAYHDTPMDMEQPDGTKVKVLVTGGVYYGELRSLDGLPLIHDPVSKYLCYATLNADESAFISTGNVYKGITILPEGSARHRETLKPEAIAAIIDQRKAAEQASGGPVIFHQQIAGPPPTTPPVPTYPVLGERRGLTLLIAFRDPADGLVKDTVPRSRIDSSLNVIGYTGNGEAGSVRDFFLDVSNGNLDYSNDVIAYYIASKPKSYYGDVEANKANPGAGIGIKSRVREMIAEALSALESRPGGYDFSQLSLIEGDKIEAINVLFAGGLPSGTGFGEGMWPHMWYLDPDEFAADGVKGYRYQIAQGGTPMGTFCHETGHLLMRWPDLYATDHLSTGIGQFGLMGLFADVFGGGMGNPLPPNPFLRWEAGWETLTDLNAMPNGISVSDVPGDFTTPRFLNVNNTNEFFLMEYMRKEGRYQNLAGEGLVIWHIDMAVPYNNYGNRTPELHYRVSVEQADGRFQLETADVYFPPDAAPIYTPWNADANDFYKAGYKTDFTVKSTPGSQWWNGNPSGLSLTNISAPGGASMSFDYQVGSCINIGTPPLIGQTSCAEISSGNYDVEGSGADIWGNNDQFTVVPPAHTYFTSAKVRVDAIENTHTWAKAGLMVRETMQANSVHASIFVTPGQGVSFQRRTAEGGASVETTVPGIQAPVWLRLDKQDGLVIGYYSQNGADWTEVGRVNTSLPRENYLAMAVSSHDDDQVASAQFRQFQVVKKVTVTASSGSNGSVSPEGVTTLDVGELFWVTITPDPGFEVREVTIDGVSQGKIDNEFYSFSFIQESHVIHVEFARFSEVELLLIHKGQPVPWAPVTRTNTGNPADVAYNYTDADGTVHYRIPYGLYEFALGDYEGYVAVPQTLQIDNPSESVTLEAKRRIEYSLTQIDALVIGNDPRTFDLLVTNNTQEAYSFDLIPPRTYHSQFSYDLGGPVFQWNDIYNTGTSLEALIHASNGSVSQPLSFSFPFYGGEYDEVNIGANGAISFSGPMGAAYTDPVALQNAPGLVAALWKNYTPWFGGRVLFQDFGDRAVIQFHYLFDPESSGNVQFQIVLHENGEILFYYNLVELAGPFFVGVQNPAMDNRLSVAGQAATDLFAGLAIGIYPRETNWLQVPIAHATVQPNQTLSLPIILDPTGLPSGEYRKNHLITRQSGETAAGPDDMGIPVTYRLFRTAIDPLQAFNVGSPAISGSHTQTGSSFFIQAAGTDIWGSQDQFYFPSETTDGDVSVTAKVNFLKNTDPWAKSGVMIRGSQSANAANVMMAVTPGNGVSFQYRSAVGGSSQFTNITGISAPVALRLTREGVRFKGYYSKNGFDWIMVGQVDINMPQQTFSGMAVTSHSPNTLTASNIGDFRIERQQGWVSKDIGDPQHPGTVTRTRDNFVITGGGRDIWDGADQFHLVSRLEEGRFSMTARIDAIDFTHNWAKAALMVRSDFAPGSRHALVGVTANRGIIFQYRSTDGGESVSEEISGIKAPVWVRLEKLGDKVTGFYSSGTGPWIEVASVDLTLGDDVQAGMAVTSHDDGAIAQASFGSVSVNRSLVAGNISRDVWNNLNGESVQDLYNSPRYQNNTPDASDFPLLFDSHRDWANNYGSRMSGYLIPKVSGYYTFWLASDNDGKLYLSPDENPDNANQIAYVNGWTLHQQWDKSASQKSQPVYLEAGNAYYLEAVHKEGWGSDNCSVAWEGPGFPREVITGNVLAPHLE